MQQNDSSKNSHSHSHSHSHGHHHSHGGLNAQPRKYNRIFAFGIALNLGFVFIEAFYGFVSHSLALMADAGHNLSDVFGLVVAWGAVWLANKKPSAQFTYGLKRSTILSALFNSIFLLLAIGGIAFEALRRLGSPNEIQTSTVMVVASVGIVINSLTALLFLRDQAHDINLKGAYLHMVADAAISFGVVVAAIVIKYSGYQWIDPIVSLLICAVIVWGTWNLLTQSIKLSMDAVPEHIDPDKVKNYFLTLSPVKEVHDLHIWPISTTETALSVHLVIPQYTCSDQFLKKISDELKKQFKIGHPTIQIETGLEGVDCELKPNDVV